jgi:hypothetical protein
VTPTAQLRVSGTPLRPFAALALGVGFTSWSAIFVRWATVSGGASAFYRVFIGELGLLAFLLLRRRIVVERRGALASITPLSIDNT